MKKIFLLFTLALFIASFAACSAPAEVKTPEAGKALFRREGIDR